MAIQSTTSLYNKYRPQTFSDVVGQQVPVMTFRNAIETGKISNAYLLSGLHGTGKTSLARIFAKALLCTDADRDEEDACGKCPSCRAFDMGALPDYIEEDAASNRGIDNIRSLISQLSLSPQVSNRKVVIIDEVHHLTSDAATSLLKKLEEPPSGVVFLLVTTDPMKLPSTIRSRCQWLRFKPISQTEISSRLARIVTAEGAVTEAGVCDLIAESGMGSMRDAVSNLSQVMAFAGNRPITCEDVSQCLGMTSMAKVRQLADALAEGDLATAMTMKFPDDEGGVKGVLRSVLTLIHRALMPADPAEPKDMTVEALRMREPTWLIHTRDVIERNFWKLDNASFPNEHVLGEMCVMIVHPETDPHCSNVLANLPVPQQVPMPAVSAPDGTTETLGRVLTGVRTVYRELRGMSDGIKGLSERVLSLEGLVNPAVAADLRQADEAPAAVTIDLSGIEPKVDVIGRDVTTLNERSETQSQALKAIIELLKGMGGTSGARGRKKRPATTKATNAKAQQPQPEEPAPAEGETAGTEFRQPPF